MLLAGAWYGGCAYLNVTDAVIAVFKSRVLRKSVLMNKLSKRKNQSATQPAEQI